MTAMQAPERPRSQESTAGHLSEADRARLTRPVRVPGAQGIGIIGFGLLAVAWSMAGSGFSPERFISGLPRIGNFLSRMWPPNFDKFDVIVRLLIETLQMAIIGTLIGSVLSLFISFGAASNISPRWLYTTCRLILNALRSIPELIYALMFVSAVGLGPFAGILALILGSIGSISKVYAEAMESVDAGPLRALESTGASRRQVIAYGILPQSAPLLTSYTLLLFEGNVRGATILGLVGAGGIGMELTMAMRLYDYGHLFAIVISIIVLVTVIDRTSAVIRRKIT
ncbi:MAG: phosphonate ABC transporter, permease protein PhnE [Ilumatobacter sp.]|nr:MAG: phosphonate ABC transporter, permease protein PhnE [Ilumatobacter sp.]